MDRYIFKSIEEDLKRKMVFVGGPRQCGKTTLARALLGSHPPMAAYFNWDSDEDRSKILKKEWNADAPLIVFDELHKYQTWKRWIKGVYDVAVFHQLGTQKPLKQSFLVTGSARLDVYRKGGDSLLGRYHYWRLHPFTLSEYPDSKISPDEALKRLMTVGGFPEPFLDGSERFAKRWRQERLNRVIKDDLRDLESIRDISHLQLFVQALRERVGSPISLNNIAQDLEVAPKTLKHWLELLEKMYLIFVVRPYSKGLGKALKKQAKVYFYDNGDVIGDEGARFENLVATSLLKRLHFLEDSQGDSYNLCYIRDAYQRETDFAILKNNKLITLIEVKWRDGALSANLKYFHDKLNPKHSVQIVGNQGYPVQKDGIRIEGPLTALTEFKFL